MVTTEIAHLIPYAQVRRHDFPNLIALCPNCHTRYDRGEIDRKAMRMYKQKLAFLSDRYSHFEIIVMAALGEKGAVLVPGPLAVKTLLDEGLIRVERELQTMEFADGTKEIVNMLVCLTEAGSTFLAHWVDPNDATLTYNE